jgi:hypothetical protein
MKRVRMGLRLMLLLVALVAVIFAWIGARRELRRINTRGELESLLIYREYSVKSGWQNWTNESAWRSSLAEMDAAIAKKRYELGEAQP